MAKYRIVEWDERYEVDDKGGVWTPGRPKRTGPLKYIRHKVHGKSQGLGWRKLIKVAGVRAAPGVFGIFTKLLEIAADEESENRGTFHDDPACPLSFILGFCDKDIKNALSVLCTIGWLNPIDNVPENSRKSGELRGNPNQISPVQVSTVQSSSHTYGESDLESLFNRFWSVYPKKKAKDAARIAFAKRKPSEALLATILVAIEAQKATDDWQRDNGRYVPYPASWLNGGRWEDHIEPVDEPVFNGCPAAALDELQKHGYAMAIDSKETGDG